MRTFFFLLLSVPLLASVVTQKVTRGEFFQSQSFNGTLSYNEQSRLAAESSGMIKKLYFDEGDFVKKGQLLLELDAEIISANIEATKASIEEARYALEKAKLDFKRYEVLLNKQSVSRQKYDEFYFQKLQLEQKLLSLESSLHAQEISKSKKSVRAPFDGVISERHVQVGEWLKEGTEIALLINPDKIDVTIHLPSSYINSVGRDKVLKLSINSRTYKAKVIGALLSGDEKTRTFPLRLRLLESEESFFDGMQASLSLQQQRSESVLLISRDAIIKRHGKEIVFVVKEKKAQMLSVQIIGFQGKMAAVASDELKEGDDVVVKGNERLFPGQEIKE